MAILSVEALSYEAGGRRILDGVTFALDRGELTVVMGPSGSGKTTLLRCVNRLLEPAAGRVLLEGEDVAGLAPPELRRRIGMVSQVPFMFAGTVRDNLHRACEYGRVEGADVDGLLRRAAFDGDADADAQQLSVGQQQRVSIARALVGRPAVLLCDEPTASLDLDNAMRLEQTFRELCAQGMAAVWVTHDRAQAERIGDRVLRLGDGRLEAA